MVRETGNLKAKQVDKLIRAGQPGSHYDGRGLRLEIRSAKSASWTARYQIDGVIRYFGLGSAFNHTLVEARERNRRLVRQKLDDGVDPVLVRRAERIAKRSAKRPVEVMTFAQASRSYLDQHKAKWGHKHATQWANTLKDYAEPVIGKLAVADIDVPLVLKVLEQPVAAEHRYPAGPLWDARPETAQRLRGRVESVLDWAKARGHRQGDNPADWSVIGKALPARPGQGRKHHAALDFKKVPAFIHELRACEGVATRALEFLILSASRSSEVLKARWSEIDLAESVWVIPGERMKMRKEHRVPLTVEAVALLRGLPREGDDGFVFVGVQAGKGLGHSTLQGVLKRMGRTDITVHGFRSSFRDFAGEETEFTDDVGEAALAHVKGKTERAYQRGDLLDKRRQLMEAWAAYLAGATVIPLQASR
jgi:integrase